MDAAVTLDALGTALSPAPRRAPPASAPLDAAALPNAAPLDAASQHARLEQMFIKHHALLWRAVRRLGATAEVAADVAQQAFLVAAERMQDIRPGCERSFLCATAITLARTRHRREQRCQLQEDMDLHEDVFSQDDPVVRRHYAQQLVDRVLRHLEPDLSLVFVLFELEGLSTAEIAEVIGAPAGTAASRLRRARELFRQEAERLEKALAKRGLT
jgi:RNA polymerase sigma-70 factor, ECF subfamily